MSVATTAQQGTVAGRPQPQTTNEPAGGPFIRHAPPGRRAIYVDTQGFGGFMSRPIVAAPGWYSAYDLKVTATTASGTGGVISANAGGQDAPWSLLQLIQSKDAFGTQLLTGPGYDIAHLVPLFSGQVGTDEMRSMMSSPIWTGITAASGAFTFSTRFPFEFAKGYGVISAANAALLPNLQINLAAASTLFSTSPSALPTLQEQLDADFYWLPNVPADPPGIGTTCQWIYQPCNPTIPTGSSTLIQLPRLGGYLTMLVMDLRDSNGARVAGYPSRPKLLVDGVSLIDSDIATIQEDIAIGMQIGAGNAPTQTAAGTVQTPLPTGVLAFSRKNSLAQRDFGLLDTGEVFLSTNPGTQIELAGYPFGTISNSPGTLNVVVGQVVPSGPLVQGLPEI